MKGEAIDRNKRDIFTTEFTEVTEVTAHQELQIKKGFSTELHRDNHGLTEKRVYLFIRAFNHRESIENTFYLDLFVD